jgi:hypothetical protein
MKEIIKTIKVYDFEELSKEIQEKLIEKEKKYQEETYCEDCLLEDMEQKATELLQEYFGEKAIFQATYYDLDFSQGSGAMIEFDLNYYNKNINIKQYGHYYHEYSFTINGDYLGEKREKQLKEKIIKINKKLSKYGYDNIMYFWDMPENEVIEILKENQYTENGNIFN